MGIDITQWRIQIANYWKFAGRTRHRKGKSPGMKAASATSCNPLLALMLSFCLITAPSLLLQAGDVEKNPGPPKMQSPPFTIDNISVQLEGVHLWGSGGLSGWLCIPAHTQQKIQEQHSTPAEQMKATVQYWLSVDPTPSWRRLIWALEACKEDTAAERLKPYAEPLTDPSLTAKNLCSVLDKVEEWWRVCRALRLPRPTQRRLGKDPSTRIQAAADWWLQYSPDAAWKNLALKLYRWEQRAAMKEASEYFQKENDPTLNLTNLESVLSGVTEFLENDSNYNLTGWLNIPVSVLNEIKERTPDETQRRRMLLQRWLEDHPTPSWAVLAQALYGAQEHAVLEQVKKKYTAGRELFEQAMKDGYVESLNIKVIFFGTAGAGKTCSKAVILGLPPPVNRVSTAIAERPVRTDCVDMNEDGECRILGPKEVKAELAAAIRSAANTQEPKIAPDESGSVTATVTDTPWSLSPSPEPMATAPEPVHKPSLRRQTAVDKDGEDTVRVRKMLKRSSTEEELVKLIDMAVVSDSVAKFKWIYFLDTGGQPQFHEFLRAFLKNASLCIYVQKLSERLDEHPLVEYYDENSKALGTQYARDITHQQIFKQCIQTMLSHNLQEDKANAPKMLVVGTHVDKEHECNETREAKNEKLIELLNPVRKQIIYYGERREQVIFPLNAHSPGEAEKAVAKEIRRVILDQCSRESEKIPLRWYALEQALQELAQQYGRDVLKKEECFAAAKNLRFDRESFETALQYLHELNIIFYYHEILPELVFCNPQVLLDKATELVKRSYELKEIPADGRACAAIWDDFAAFGYVTEELLSKFNKHYTPGIFSHKDLIKLFKELLILADLNGTEYFMPAVLRMLDQKQITECQASCVSESACAPLVIYFPRGVGLGILCSLVVFLLSEDNHLWELELDDTPARNPTCLFRNCIKFIIPDFPGSSVTLFDTFDFFEVHVCADSEFLSELCPLVRKAIFTGLEKACRVLSYNNMQPHLGFVCPCTSSCASHVATITNKNKSWMCSKNRRFYGKLKEEHQLWLTQPESGNEDMPEPPDPKRRKMDKFGNFCVQIKQKCDDIIEFLLDNAVTPEDFATKLKRIGLIKNAVWEKADLPTVPKSERMRTVMDAVISRLKLNEENVENFKSVLDKFGVLEDISEIIKL